jgi:hypothetical protein
MSSSIFSCTVFLYKVFGLRYGTGTVHCSEIPVNKYGTGTLDVLGSVGTCSLQILFLSRFSGETWSDAFSTVATASTSRFLFTKFFMLSSAAPQRTAYSEITIPDGSHLAL